MKNIKRILVSIALIAFVFLIIVVISVQSMAPDYKGIKYLDGLTEEVQVYYDTYGVPHIYGQTEEDAFKSLGYVHAQDRLWQMEVLRRIGSGRLSELFG
ncbi:MAG: penicillin acylase family protein, partial [Flavobacteriaceae bacterium]|nr:penicillin acylase family protein [Flavobacteriaceae bacterium]